MCKFSGLAFSTFILFGCANVFATQGDVGPVYIQSVGVISLVSGGGHQAGNMEIRIQGGFSMPAGIACDPNYITTLKTSDPDKKLFALASMAQASKQPVFLHITDDSALTAFPGRCSLMTVSVGN